VIQGHLLLVPGRSTSRAPLLVRAIAMSLVLLLDPLVHKNQELLLARPPRRKSLCPALLLPPQQGREGLHPLLNLRILFLLFKERQHRPLLLHRLTLHHQLLLPLQLLFPKMTSQSLKNLCVLLLYH